MFIAELFTVTKIIEETTQVSINRWRDEDDDVYTHTHTHTYTYTFLHMHA